MTAILTTERLEVRQFTAADLDGLHGICGDPRTMRHVGEGQALTRQRCAEWLEESLTDYATRGYGASAVCLTGTASLAGYCGIVAARRRADPELIYALRRDLWGRGLASELVPALIDWGFRGLRLPRLVATVRPENHASVRVLEKAGMHCAGEELAGEGVTLLVYALEAPPSPQEGIIGV